MKWRRGGERGRSAPHRSRTLAHSSLAPPPLTIVEEVLGDKLSCVVISLPLRLGLASSSAELRCVN